MRYFIELSYNGTRYHGWQIQHNAHTVQAELNCALSLLLSQPIASLGCGRTDAGVHAHQFFAHFDSENVIEEPNLLVIKLNKYLPADICIYRIFEVQPTANVRFDALSRTYQYFITTIKNPFLQDFTHFIPYPLDIKAMNAAAKLLLKATDFTSFAKLHGESKTNLCSVTQAVFAENKETHTIVFTITSNRFLRSMVRSVVGTLIDVGRGKLSIDDMSTIIANENRAFASASAPAAGLFLWEIRYPFL